MWEWPYLDIGGGGVEFLVFLAAAIFGILVFITSLYFLGVVYLLCFLIAVVGGVFVRILTKDNRWAKCWGVFCAMGSFVASGIFFVLTPGEIAMQDFLCCIAGTVFVCYLNARIGWKIAYHRK